jgi:hypothetical protein
LILFAGSIFVAFVFATGVFALASAVLAFTLAALLATTLLTAATLLAPAASPLSVVFALFDSLRGALFGVRLTAGDFAPNFGVDFAFDFNSFFMGNASTFSDDELNGYGLPSPRRAGTLQGKARSVRARLQSCRKQNKNILGFSP